LKVEGRLALVTGASSGIGREIARHLAADGYDLLLVARREDRLRELATELESKHGRRIHVLPIDLTETDAIDRVVEYVEKEKLQIDMLVNNAGFGSVGPFHEIDRDTQIDMIKLNVVALTDLSRRLLPGMVERGRGQVLNVASSAAFQPAPVMGVYHATKAFVLFLTEAIAEEVRGTGVTATALCPGPVAHTEFGENTGTHEKVPGLGVVRVDASKVARLGIKGALRGKTIVVPGLFMRLSSWISPRLPRWLVRKITHLIQLSRT
jgi:short-subunit dehydrogenase